MRTERGLWGAREQFEVDRALVIAPVREACPLADHVQVLAPERALAAG